MSIVNAKCPNCGASIQLDNERSEGFCSYCGSKVEVEEAQKLMIQGTVKVDTSDELANLYQVARRAKDAGNSENAQKYYDMILVKDPNSWEATFYVTYYQAMQCRIAGISNAALSVTNSFPSVLRLVKEANYSNEEEKDIITEIYLRSLTISQMLYEGSKDFYEDTDPEIKYKYAGEHIERGIYSAAILKLLSSEIEVIFSDKYDELRVEALIKSINMYQDVFRDINKRLEEKDLDLYKEEIEFIKRHKPEFTVTAAKPSESGCYIATSIYGSYDCPQVWTLRRFRDDTLDAFWFGRCFIKTYYAISPTLVKWFGKSAIFKGVFTPILDKMVKSLKNNGVSDKPYNDKY